ncbi:MAG: ABC transporter permease [Chloroflexi bacterium]|nr:MAG: ABC transporter permease [Chloroflexota bacterium]
MLAVGLLQTGVAGMAKYVLRRLIGMIPTWLIIMFMVVFMVRLIPGSIVDLLLQDQGGGGSYQAGIDRAQVEHRLGLDQPVYVQYVKYVAGVAQGNLGASLWDQQSVVSLIAQRVPVTAQVALVAIVTSVFVSIPIGVISAVRRDSPVDYLLRSISILGISVPGFAIGTAIVIFPTLWWGVTVSFKYVSFADDPIGHLKLIIPPAMVLGVQLSASVARLTRTMMLEVLQEDYIRTARAKGLQEPKIVVKHALKNALIPVVTVLGIQITNLLGGSVITETIFALPGLGRLMVSSIGSRDYPVVQGIVVMTAIFVMCMNLAVDVSYGYLDPRARPA